MRLFRQPLRRPFSTTPPVQNHNPAKKAPKSLGADFGPPAGPLPSLPPAPPYPCPQLSDFSSFQPLYLRQWSVFPSHTTRSLSLRKAFSFHTLTAAAQFVNGILGPAGISEKEGHHPDRIQITSLGVLLSLKTHSAFIQDDFKKRVVKPGLTDRDFRLAILIERMFYENFGDKTKETDTNLVDILNCLLQPQSLSDVAWSLDEKNSLFKLEFSED